MTSWLLCYIPQLHIMQPFNFLSSLSITFSAISLLNSCASSVSIASVEVVPRGVLKGLSLLSLSTLSSFSFQANSQVFGPKGGGRLGYFPLLVCIFSKSAMDIGSVTLNCWEASCGASCLVFFLPFSLVAIMTSRTMIKGYVEEVKKQDC